MPLSFDLPIESLKTYRGINPRPVEFDDYWDAALKEMRAVDPELEFVTAPFECPFCICEDIYFTGVGGARLHAKLLRPKEEASSHPAIVMFHGYGGHSGSWSQKLQYVAMGYTVAAFDCRGQGGLSEDKGGVEGNTLRGHIIRGLEGPAEHLLFRQIFLDAAQLASIVMELPKVDASRVGAMGASQGGGLTLACAALEPGIKLAAPDYPFLCDYKRVWEIDLAKDAYFELQQYFRLFDPLHEQEEQVFSKLGHIDVQHLAHRIKAKVFMAVGLMDTVCPPSSQFAAYNKIQADKQLALYPDFGHETLPGRDDAVFQFMREL